MKTLKRLLSYPARYRRSLGFGVHSPFAYNFITSVLRLKGYGYYAYPETSGFCPRARKAGFNEIFAGRDMSAHEAHLIFRVLCFFNPSHVVELGHGHEVTNILFKRAVPSAKVIRWTMGRGISLLPSDSPLFLLVNPISMPEIDEAEQFLLEKLKETECVAVVRNISTFPLQQSLWESICKAEMPGMGFTDGHIGIFVTQKGLPHTIFDLVL